MRPKEDYTRFVSVALVLSVAILLAFQLYIFREPARIAADEAQDMAFAVAEGQVLFSENCVVCHGAEGEGVDGPALNDKRFLANTADETIFSLISSGVPGTTMPAWNQAHGGPLTDEQVRQLVAFIRSWEETAPDRQALAMMGDPINGLVIYNSTCVVCHGENGQGTDRAPALYDLEKLSQFDNDWYRETIAEGRPSQGMPTWGTVLSPVEIQDVISLLRAWEAGETVEMPGPEAALAEALHMLEHGDMHGTEHALEEAARGASGEVLAAINRAIEAADANDQAAIEEAIREAQTLLGVPVNADEHDEGDAHEDGDVHDESAPVDEHNDGDVHDESAPVDGHNDG